MAAPIMEPTSKHSKVFLQVGRPSCRPTNNVKASKHSKQKYIMSEHLPDTFCFCLTDILFCRSLRVRPGLPKISCKIPKRTFCDCWWDFLHAGWATYLSPNRWDFYMPDGLPVTQPTVSTDVHLLHKSRPGVVWYGIVEFKHPTQRSIGHFGDGGP